MPTHTANRLAPRTVAGAAIIAVAVGAAVSAAAPAQAEANPPGCPRGYVCGYSGLNQTGRVVFRSFGDFEGPVYAKSVFNNGARYAGPDHIQLTWDWPASPASSRCLHRNPYPDEPYGGQYKINIGTAYNAPVVLGARWRGEC
ncbi:hypothetical protein BJF79_30300 [Actinomadura sp. CNU-125]|nr:hypothetical protein BJF79_30300 [Actinomadura sp. CNU-125]